MDVVIIPYQEAWGWSRWDATTTRQMVRVGDLKSLVLVINERNRTLHNVKDAT